MGDPLSMMASCLAVAGLGVKVTKILDTLMNQWQDSELILVSLQTQVGSFCASLKELSDWMEDEFLESTSSNNLNFTGNLARCGEGCMRFLLALKIELDIICEGNNRLRWRDKATLWNRGRIKELQEHLSCQTQGLILLLNW